MKWRENCEVHGLDHLPSRKPEPVDVAEPFTLGFGPRGMLVDGDLVERIARVCVEKARQLPSSEEWLETVIGTAVADTCLILTGTFRIESLEADLEL